MMNLPNPASGTNYGRWTLVRRIGAGGHGDVWLAESGGERVAIKILTKTKPIAYARFLSEVQVMKRCGIEGVIPIIDQFLPEDPTSARAWYAMPLGVPLTKELASRGLREIVAAVAGIAETLAKLHAVNVVHRDVKPANLLWVNGRPAIGDFGLVDYPGKDDLTGKREELGPRWTMAPEVRRNSNTIDAKPADVYSLAKTLWILIRREDKGFEGQYSSSTSVAITGYVGGRFVAVLEALLTSATEHSPLSRPPMSAFAAELREWLRVDEKFDERNPLEWAEAQRQLFPISTPTRAMWDDIDAIVSVLTVAATRTNMNHMFLPMGGGLDLYGAVRSTREAGCIELKAGATHILRPARLMFESFGQEQQWDYFRLEAAPLEPSGVYARDFRGGYEEVTDVDGELYAERYCCDEDYYHDEPLPPNSRVVLRHFSGAFVIF